MVGREAMDAPDGWEILLAAGEICRKIGVALNVMRGKGNAYGASLAGILPDAAPGGRPLEEAAAELRNLWGEVNEGSGMTAPEIIEAAAAGGIDLLYVAGAEFLHYRGKSAARNPELERMRQLSHIAYYEKHLPRWTPLLRAYLRATGKV